MTKISTRQLATLKRNAQSIYPKVAEREKLQAKIAELQEELAATEAFIDATETGSRLITGGLNSTDIIQRRVVVTDKLDAKGNPVKVTKWEPIADRLIANEDGSYTIVMPADVDVAPADVLAEPINEQEEQSNE